MARVRYIKDVTSFSLFFDPSLPHVLNCLNSMTPLKRISPFHKLKHWNFAESLPTNGGIYKCCPCPFIQILSRFYPDFIQILSRFYPDFIQILSRFYPDFIQILSRFYPIFLKTHFIQILSYFLKKSG
jgi:hypothetical protein